MRSKDCDSRLNRPCWSDLSLQTQTHSRPRFSDLLHVAILWNVRRLSVVVVYSCLGCIVDLWQVQFFVQPIQFILVFYNIPKHFQIHFYSENSVPIISLDFLHGCMFSTTIYIISAIKKKSQKQIYNSSNGHHFHSNSK